MKEAFAYKSTYFVIDCPYCGHTHYLDIEDMYDGHVEGRKLECQACGKTFIVTEA